MLSVAEAQTRVDALTTEAAALEAALLDLEKEQEAHGKELDAAFVAAERQPTPQAQRAANQLEAHANLLNNQVRRKRVALESCKADLAEARTQLQRAQHAATVVEIEGVYAELVDIAAQLDANPLQAPLWRRVAEIHHQGNALYRQVKTADVPWRDGIFPDAGIVVTRVIQRFAATLGAAVDIRGVRQHPIDFATVAEAMDLAMLVRQITHLRRLHIEPLEQATAPVAVPV